MAGQDYSFLDSNEQDPRAYGNREEMMKAQVKKTNKNLKKASKKHKKRQEDKKSIEQKQVQSDTAALIEFKLSELKHELMSNSELLDQSQNECKTVEEARDQID